MIKDLVSLITVVYRIHVYIKQNAKFYSTSSPCSPYYVSEMMTNLQCLAIRVWKSKLYSLDSQC